MEFPIDTQSGRLDIAIIGAGISGMAAAWLLSHQHNVTVYEASSRIGGHSNTVDASTPSGIVPVDTGFIVYNELNYPNLTALFRLLEVPTAASEMTFAVSLDGGALEYAGTSLGTLFGQRRNVVSPRFWAMLRDLRRFYRDASKDIGALDDKRVTLGEYLGERGYGAAFQEDHLLPMAAAIWSSAPADVRGYPAAQFIRFCDNHGLLKISGRPPWRTVVGGSREYVARLTARYADRVQTGRRVQAIRREGGAVWLRDDNGATARFDHAVVTTHADQALGLLEDPSEGEKSVLGAFRYAANLAVLHSDPGLMPKRRAVWSSWNYLGRRGEGGDAKLSVTYWMNRLQPISPTPPLFVTLNPLCPPRADTILHSEIYEHPQFDLRAMQAQRRLWSLQGQRGTWFCGAYFGSGFHEDGLQAGLAVAEALGGMRRPWTVAGESDRIHLPSAAERAA